MSAQYEWRAPWLYKGIDANKIKQELTRVEVGEELDPEMIVTWAKDHPRSELHKIFEWSNAKAGQRWRAHQARLVLGNLRKVIVKGGNVTLQRTHFAVKGHHYVTRERLKDDPDARNQVLHRARKAIEELIERCHEIETLASPKEVERLSTQLLDLLHEAEEVYA